MTAQLPPAQRLVGPNLVVTPFTSDDVEDMARVQLDERVYQHGYAMYHRPTELEDARRIARGYVQDGSDRDGKGNGRLAFCFRLGEGPSLGPAGTFVGSSSLGEAHLQRESVHLGWTIYDPQFWGTGTNAEAKWLLLGHCFASGMGRVKIQTDILNTRSQAAIAKLGATREGVLRREQPREDGTWRDTVVFSILRDEWPTVEQGLLARIPR